ncbi:32192_t:CDS:1, partial [Racocetra persica]
EVFKGFILDKCQAYYLQNPSSSGNSLASEELASEELLQYISYLQSQFDENIDVYKWWKISKHEFPGLATLARKYLPLVSNYEMQSNNLKNL